MEFGTSVVDFLHERFGADFVIVNQFWCDCSESSFHLLAILNILPFPNTTRAQISSSQQAVPLN